MSSFFKPVDPAGNGVLVLGAQKDPSDPQYADDDGIKDYKADVAKYGGGANPNDGSVLTGYNIGTVVVQNLKDAANVRRHQPRQPHERGVEHQGQDAGLASAAPTRSNGNDDAYPWRPWSS